MLHKFIKLMKIVTHRTQINIFKCSFSQLEWSLYHGLQQRKNMIIREFLKVQSFPVYRDKTKKHYF